MERRAYEAQPVRVLKRIWHFSRRNCLSRKGKAVEHTLTFQQMVDIWHAQKGLCYYLKIPMVLLTASDWKCSLERRDPSKGYTSENCVLCCHEMNGACQWTPEKVSEFKNHLAFPIEHEFQITDSVHRFVSYLWSSARSSSSACRKKGRAGKGEFDITVEYLIDILTWQDGKCHYSGIPMNFEKKSTWKASLERLDPLLGYTEGNVVFICWEFNTFDNTHRIVYSNGGSCNWSKDKIEKIRSHVA